METIRNKIRSLLLAKGEADFKGRERDIAPIGVIFDGHQRTNEMRIFMDRSRISDAAYLFAGYSQDLNFTGRTKAAEQLSESDIPENFEEIFVEVYEETRRSLQK